MTPYLQQKASPWVSAAVLAGGMTVAIILFMLVRIQNNLEAYSPSVETGSASSY